MGVFFRVLNINTPLIEVTVVPDNHRTHATFPWPFPHSSSTPPSERFRGHDHLRYHSNNKEGSTQRGTRPSNTDCTSSFHRSQQQVHGRPIDKTIVQARGSVAANHDNGNDIDNNENARRPSYANISHSNKRFSSCTSAAPSRPRLLSRWNSDPRIVVHEAKDAANNQSASSRSPTRILEPPCRLPSLTMEKRPQDIDNHRNQTSQSSRWDIGVDRNEQSPDQMRLSNRHLQRRRMQPDMSCHQPKRRPCLGRWDSDSRMQSSSSIESLSSVCSSTVPSHTSTTITATSTAFSVTPTNKLNREQCSSSTTSTCTTSLSPLNTIPSILFHHEKELHVVVVAAADHSSTRKDKSSDSPFEIRDEENLSSRTMETVHTL